MNMVLFAILGTAFGWVLSRCGASDYDVVQGMFLWTDFQLWGVIGVAVAVTAPGLWLLKRRRTTAFGAPLSVKPKPRHPGNIVGGAIFGIGWAVTGMCPGPILVNIGEGKLYALAGLCGALVGAALFGELYVRMPAWLRLPALRVGTGDG